MIQYKKGYKYQLFKAYSIQTNIRPVANIKTHFLTLNVNGLLRIKRGYSWDGPSGPAIDTKGFMRGSLIHDALYQLISMRRLSKKWRKEADVILKTVCRGDGMSRIRASWVYFAVRKFGGFFVSTDKKVYTAP